MIGLFHPPTGLIWLAALVFGKYEKPNKKSRNMLDTDFLLWEDCFKNGRSVSSFKGKCGIQANWSSRVMLKSKQGKSIETWHVGLCPHATQQDIRHTSHHDWISTYVPKMVNILPQSQHGTKIPNQWGFPCSYIEQNLQLALRLLLVSYLCLSLIHPPENSISLSDPSIPFPSSSTP